VQKNFGFLKLMMVCPHGQGGVEPGHFADKERRGQFFAICADVFYGWPLKSLSSGKYW